LCNQFGFLINKNAFFEEKGLTNGAEGIVLSRGRAVGQHIEEGRLAKEKKRKKKERKEEKKKKS